MHLDVSTPQIPLPLLHLDVSTVYTLQRAQLDLDTSTLPRPVLHLDLDSTEAYPAPGPVYDTDALACAAHGRVYTCVEAVHFVLTNGDLRQRE
jgi:hypothetical protein